MKSELARLLEKHGVTLTFKFGELPKSYKEKLDNWQLTANRWTVTLKRGRMRLSSAFFTGTMIGEPTAADVAFSLIRDAESGEMGFNEFCDEFGYDSDSIRIESIHRQCVRISPKVRRFFGDLYKDLQAAEH